MTKRLLILSVLFVAAAAYNVRAMQPELVPPREPLTSLPMSLDRWQAREATPLTAEVLAVLGVDEYVSRFYYAPKEAPVSLYVGYYQSQREGDSIHSPMNCLPGAGWEPESVARATIPIEGGESITVNRFVIRKGVDRQVVLYWYQSHGRVVASEYWSKAYMVLDAMRYNRSDAALVRVVSPVLSTDVDESLAAARVTEFVQALFPQLARFLPS